MMSVEINIGHFLVNHVPFDQSGFLASGLTLKVEVESSFLLRIEDSFNDFIVTDFIPFHETLF